MSNYQQQHDDLEEKLLQKTEDKKKKKMKVSGKSIFGLQKIINKKTPDDYTINDHQSNNHNLP